MKTHTAAPILLAVWLEVAAGTIAPMSAATLAVSSTNDSGPGSLRQTIQNAAPGDTINFAVAGAITLTNGELVIATNHTRVGPGPPA